MIKVVHIIENLISGGKERRLVELLKGSLNSPDVENYLLVLSDEIHYKEVLDMKYMIVSRSENSEMQCLFKSYSYIKKINPDIIHSWGGLASAFASVISFLQRRKFVNGMVTAASDKFPLKTVLYSKFSFPFSDLIVSNSLAGLDAFRVPKNKRRHVYNGFNNKRLENLKSKEEILERFSIKTQYVIGMVANVTAHKDYDTYLEAASKILNQRNDVTFLCIGKDRSLGAKQGTTIEDYRRAYPSEKIIFTGMQNDIESISNILDIGVLITHNHGEGISNSILEYMALGKPVIATDKGGTVELVERDKNGFLIGYENPEDLVKSIQTLLDDPALREKMGKRSKEIVKEKFSIENMVQRTIEIYISLMEK